jgi:hypothetical protein
MSMITISSDDGGPHIERWPDSGGIAVITWRSAADQTFQQEVADEQEAIRLLETIDTDDQLVLISAQLRRRGIGPAG